MQLVGIAPIFVETGARGEIQSAIAQLVRQRIQALVLLSSVGDQQFEIVEAAMKHRLPILAENPESVREAGAPIGYDATRAEQFRLRAEYIDRILRGAKPSELPVQQPKIFELVINLKTARALGLTIPKELLLRADEVIQ